MTGVFVLTVAAAADCVNIFSILCLFLSSSSSFLNALAAISSWNLSCSYLSISRCSTSSMVSSSLIFSPLSATFMRSSISSSSMSLLGCFFDFEEVVAVVLV